MEWLVEDIRGLPSSITNTLSNQKDMDKLSRDKIIEINNDEKMLFEELQTISKLGTQFDEVPFQTKYQNIVSRRHEVLTLLDNQIKSMQLSYEEIDRNISEIGPYNIFKLYFLLITRYKN